MRTVDYPHRPHFELFREPPSPEFLHIDRFLPDRLLEATFESVRQEQAPHAPSRKTSVFTFVCRGCAEWFRDNSSQRREARIVVVSVTPSSRVFVADLSWRNVAANVLLQDRWREPEFPFQEKTQMEALRRVAEAYWRGESPDAYKLGTIPEALIDGEVIVVSSE
jgi:hypothetical protein